jgi:tRNA G18 (ribose-2'-O)-methylase SpoU
MPVVARFATLVDPADDRLRPYTALTDADHRRRVETATGTFVVEGVTAIRRAFASPYPVRSVLVTPAKAAALDDVLRTDDVDVFVARQETMDAVAGFPIHRGAVAIADRLPLAEPADVVRDARMVVVLEGINDHENLGAIARSARALGVDALILDPTTADPLYRRAVRVSMGELLHLPYSRAREWPDALATVSDAGFAIVALTPSPNAAPIDDVASEALGRPVALLFGAEGPGLSAPAMAAADWRARIPIRPGTDSLNVGHAAAIAFHAFARHR